MKITIIMFVPNNVLYGNYMCVTLFLLQHTSTSNIYILFK